jgi:hypothetical protein
MANPTTNFGWQMPTSTDLVTDLPADFEVFGQAVDTALVDLKGGTTGQVLSKASNTNMDFTWVTTDDANAIQNSIVDAKGDLIAASANDTPARLAVGTNGHVLTADSTTATGLKWAAVASGGKVLQVVYGTTTTQTANSTSTYADTTLTATITPTSSSSKVLVILSQAGVYSDVNGNGMQLRLLRGGTTILTFAGALGTLGGSTARRDVATATTYLDSPATTSATTYKTQFASRTNSATVQVQVTTDDTSTITLLEIGA